MNYQIFLIIFSFYSLFGFVKGFLECKKMKNPFGHAFLFLPIGAFVWGDALILGIFWTVVTLVTFFLDDFLLFLLFYSLFWTVRSMGEILYWMNQQFSHKSLEQPEWWWSYKLVGDRAVWFINQLVWQCALVITIILSLYFSTLWVQSL